MTSVTNIVVQPRQYFCDLSLSLDGHNKKILSMTSRIKDTSWYQFHIEGRDVLIDHRLIGINLELCVLESLRQDPLSALSEQEQKHLFKTKQFEKKTQFFLSSPGGIALTGAAVLSAFSGGLGYYYGIKQPSMDPVELAALFASAAFIASFASNLLGFYITGTLPHNASNADNTEQNIWEKFAVCKIKPAAYQLLQWYSPEKKTLESESSFEARRALASAYASCLKLDDIVAEFKLNATQAEKIDVAFSDLYEAVSLIKMQKLQEAGQLDLMPISGQLSFTAKMLGYFR